MAKLNFWAIFTAKGKIKLKEVLIKLPIKIMGKNLHFNNSANSSSTTKVTLTSTHRRFITLVFLYISVILKTSQRKENGRKMESSIPVTIPCGLNSGPVDQGSNTHGTFLPRSCSQSLVGRQNSLVISGSFFGASSINHPRYFFPIHFLYFYLQLSIHQFLIGALSFV